MNYTIGITVSAIKMAEELSVFQSNDCWK